MLRLKLDARIVFPLLFFTIAACASWYAGNTQEILLTNQAPLTCSKEENTFNSNMCPLTSTGKHRIVFENQDDIRGDQLVIGIFCKSIVKEAEIIIHNNTNTNEVKISLDGAILEINKKTKAVVKRREIDFESDYRALVNFRAESNITTLAVIHEAKRNPDVYYAVEIYQIRAFFVRRIMHQYWSDDAYRGASRPYLVFYTSEIQGNTRVEQVRSITFWLVVALSCFWILRFFKSPLTFLTDRFFWITLILTGVSIVYLLPENLFPLPIGDTLKRVLLMAFINFALDCFIYGRGLPKPLGEVLMFASAFFHLYYGLTLEQSTRDTYNLDMPRLTQFRDIRPGESQTLVRYFHTLKFYPVLISAIYIAFFSNTASENTKKVMPALTLVLAWFSCLDHGIVYEEREKNPFKLAYEFWFIPWMVGLFQFIMVMAHSNSYLGMTLTLTDTAKTDDKKAGAK